MGNDVMSAALGTERSRVLLAVSGISFRDRGSLNKAVISCKEGTSKWPYSSVSWIVWYGLPGPNNLTDFEVPGGGGHGMMRLCPSALLFHITIGNASQ